MKASILSIVLTAALSATPILAEGDMKCGCMKEHDAKAEMQKKEADLTALLDQMNVTVGDKKIDAMAALLNKLLQERKAMQEKMAAMCEKMAPEKKPDAESNKPAEHQH